MEVLVFCFMEAPASHQAAGVEVLPIFGLNIEIFPGSTPGRPAPRVCIFRKIVTTVHVGIVRAKLSSANGHYPLVIAVMVEEEFTELEKALVREAIVFQY